MSDFQDSATYTQIKEHNTVRSAYPISWLIIFAANSIVYLKIIQKYKHEQNVIAQTESA